MKSSSLRSLIGLVIGLVLSLALCAVVGENPWHVFKTLVIGAAGTAEDLGLSLFYATSLMFTGLAVAVSFRAGLFNIGAEGQLLAGSLVSTFVALQLSVRLTSLLPMALTGPVTFVMVFVFAALGGGLWGGFAGAVKAWRGAHEVIITMMMNLIAAGLVSWAVVGPLQNPDSQNPETSLVSGAFHFVSWDPVASRFAPLNISFVLAIALCAFFWWFFARTLLGFHWRVLGLNPGATRFNGIDQKKLVIIVMTVSGALAGLVALNDIFGSAGKLRLGFSADYGFAGIAVALLARNHPLGVIPAAILFGALQKGSADLDLETTFINRDFAKIIQAILVLSVIAGHQWRWPMKSKEAT